jgi:hypothetical protein
MGRRPLLTAGVVSIQLEGAAVLVPTCCAECDPSFEDHL